MFVCCTPYVRSREEVVGGTGVNDERIPPADAEQILTVRLYSVRDLQEDESLVPFVFCEVPGKPETRTQPIAVASACEPVQFVGAEIQGFCIGDPIKFTVSDLGGKNVLGQVQLSSRALQPDGFAGEVLLQSSKPNVKAYLTVSLCRDPTFCPVIASPSMGFQVTIDPDPEVQQLGLELDMMDRTYARVIELNEGPVQAHNRKAAYCHRLHVNDYICSVNGCKGPKEFPYKFKKEKQLNLHIRRPVKFVINVQKKDGALGLDLYYEDNESPALLVTKVGEGPVSDWNADNPGKWVGRFDRIISVNGRSGKSVELLEMLKDAKEDLELTILRPSKEGVSCSPVNIFPLTKVSTNDLGLLPQPEQPQAKIALIEVFVRTEDFGPRKQCQRAPL
jgi:hypothetical protein